MFEYYSYRHPMDSLLYLIEIYIYISNLDIRCNLCYLILG